MKQLSFRIAIVSLAVSGAVVAYAVVVAFINGFYWADRFKDAAVVPDSVQALLALTGWVFWGGIAIVLAQIIAILALFKVRRGGHV